MRPIVSLFLALAIASAAPTAGRSAEGENPHCGALQAEQLTLTRNVRLLGADIANWTKEIADDQRQIVAMEDEAVREGHSRTGNVTSQTSYYKERIAESMKSRAALQRQRRGAEQRLAYVQGRQRVYDCALSFDLSGEWILTWTWSVTSVDFAGTVSGGAGHWTYTGTLAGGGNAVWSPKKGSGTVNCTLSGTMGAKGTIECNASFSDPQPSSWTGTATGALEAMSSGAKRNFEFSGRNGHGQASGQPPAGIETLQLQPKD
jgi:hypothetical protein